MDLGLVSALLHKSSSIPRDFAFAGCDDGVDKDEMLIPTTSIHFSYEETTHVLLSLVQRRLHTMQNLYPIVWHLH